MVRQPGKGPENAWLEMAKKLGSAALDFAEGKGRPDRLLDLAVQSAKGLWQHFSEKKAGLDRMDKEIGALRKQGDELEAMVRANWAGLKKCTSDKDYLLEELRLAGELEKSMEARKTQKKLEE